MSLVNSNDPYSLIIICPDTVYDTPETDNYGVHEYAAWKTGTKGIKTLVVKLSDIYTDEDYDQLDEAFSDPYYWDSEEYPEVDNPMRIRNFIKDAFAVFADTSNPLEYVLLCGYGDTLPYRNFATEVGPYSFHNGCDLYYSHLDGTWLMPNLPEGFENYYGFMPNNDYTEHKFDMLRDIAVGRLLCHKAIEYNNYFSKVYAYYDSQSDKINTVIITGDAEFKVSNYGSLKNQMTGWFNITEINFELDENGMQILWNAYQNGINIVFGSAHSNHFTTLSINRHVNWTVYNGEFNLDTLMDGNPHTIYLKPMEFYIRTDTAFPLHLFFLFDIEYPWESSSAEFKCQVLSHNYYTGELVFEAINPELWEGEGVKNGNWGIRQFAAGSPGPALFEHPRHVGILENEIHGLFVTGGCGTAHSSKDAEPKPANVIGALLSHSHGFIACVASTNLNFSPSVQSLHTDAFYRLFNVNTLERRIGVAYSMGRGSVATYQYLRWVRYANNFYGDPSLVIRGDYYKETIFPKKAVDGIITPNAQYRITNLIKDGETITESPFAEIILED